MSANQTQIIERSSDLRKYRTELPNLYDDWGLNPYEFRLLAHYVRVGTCWEAVRTTAEKCNMSVAAVVRARDSLANVHKLIRVQRDGGRRGPGATVTITVIDMWEENFERYSKRSHVVVSGSNNVVSGSNNRINPIKKQPSKKKPDEEQQQPAREKQAAAVVVAASQNNPFVDEDEVYPENTGEWVPEPEHLADLDESPEDQAEDDEQPTDHTGEWLALAGEIASQSGFHLLQVPVKFRRTFIAFWLYAICQDTIKQPGYWAKTRMEQLAPTQMLAVMEEITPGAIVAGSWVWARHGTLAKQGAEQIKAAEAHKTIQAILEAIG